jgi:hypothetical protein
MSDIEALTVRVAHGRTGRGGRALTVAIWSVPAVALALGLHSLRLANSADIGPLGLITALRPELYVALGVLTASFVGCVFRPCLPSSTLLAAHVVVLVVLLFGSATLIEQMPRGTTGWVHVGFTDYIARTGGTLPELDARFSWPGFFALMAMATRAAGMKDALPLLGWMPVGLNLVYGAGVFQLARATSTSVRSAWLAVWLFFPLNWVGQDYFAPQGLSYLFYLVVLTVLLVWFRPARPERVIRLPSAPMQHEMESPTVGQSSLVGLIWIVLIVFVATTASHQLTPMAIVMSVGGLVVVRRCTLRSLPILLGVIVVGYISYLTVPYWSGHLHDMLGSFGNVGDTVHKGAINRVNGDAAHRQVVLSRIILTVSVWALAAIGAWRRMRHAQGDLGLLVLAGAPFVLLMMQSYGGEILLRVYAFNIPFAAVLVAALFAPAWPARRPVAAAVMAGVLSAVLTGAFFIARYGNESFEQVRTADVQAVNWLYSHAPEGASLIAATSNVPWRSQGIERYEYQPLDVDLGPTAVPAIESQMRRNPHGAFLILTKGQFVHGEAFLGLPRHWGENLECQLADSGRFRLVYANAEAKVYVLAASTEEDDGKHGCAVERSPG